MECPNGWKIAFSLGVQKFAAEGPMMMGMDKPVDLEVEGEW